MLNKFDKTFNNLMNQLFLEETGRETLNANKKEMKEFYDILNKNNPGRRFNYTQPKYIRNLDYHELTLDDLRFDALRQTLMNNILLLTPEIIDEALSKINFNNLKYFNLFDREILGTFQYRITKFAKNFDEAFFLKYYDLWDFYAACSFVKNIKLSDKTLERLLNDPKFDGEFMTYVYLFEIQRPSDDFLRKYMDKFTKNENLTSFLDSIASNLELPEDIIIKYKDKLPIIPLYEHQKMSDEIRKSLYDKYKRTRDLSEWKRDRLDELYDNGNIYAYN